MNDYHSLLPIFITAFLQFPVQAADSDQIVVPECRVKFIEQAVLASERNGVVSAIDIREGDTVRMGQRVAHLKDDVPRAQLATLIQEAESPQSTAKIEDAQLAEQFAVERFKIAQQAKGRNTDAVSRAEMLELEVAALRAGKEIDKAVLELDLAKLKKSELEAELRSYQLLAPFAGTVVRVLKHRGESVQMGDPVAEVVDATRLKVEGYVTATQARRLRAGMTVLVHEELDDATAQVTGNVQGRLIFVDVGVEPVSQRVRIWAEIDNAGLQLRPGVQARMEIDTSRPPEVEPVR